MEKRKMICMMVPLLGLMVACSRGLEYVEPRPAVNATVEQKQPQPAQDAVVNQQPQDAIVNQQPQPIANGTILKKKIDTPIRTRAVFDLENAIDVSGNLTIDNSKVSFVADNNSQRVEFNISNIRFIKMDDDFEAINDVEFYDGVREYDFDVDRNTTRKIYEHFNVMID